MIKSILLAGFLVLAGCTTTQVAQVQQIVDSVVAITEQVAPKGCLFVPVADTVIAIWNAEAAATFQKVADDICAAVAGAPKLTVRFRGTIVHGTFIAGPNAGKTI